MLVSGLAARNVVEEEEDDEDVEDAKEEEDDDDELDTGSGLTEEKEWYFFWLSVVRSDFTFLYFENEDSLFAFYL